MGDYMEVANTSFNLGDAGSSNVDTSSSISNGINGSQQTNQSSSINTGSYQSNGIYTGAETETYDLSVEAAEDNRNVIQRVGDWISDTAASAYETGANIVSDAYSWIAGGLKGIGSTLEETAANLASDVGTFAAKVGSAFLDGYTALMSTEAVIATSVVSGVAKLGEHVVDVALWCGGKVAEGRAYVAGTIVGLFDKDIGDAIKNAGHQASQQMKEWIEFDAVGEANKWFYESTDLGRWINDNSYMKYDSEAAMKIRGISEKAAEFAAATALTIATGGLATFAIGALYGIGKQAESTYQRNGTDTTLLQEAGILGSGALTGLSWLAKGKLGAGFLEIGKAATEVGVGEIVSKISKDILTKDFWLKAFKDGLTGVNGLGNYAASAMMTGEDIIPYLNGEKPWDAQAIGTIALAYLKNLGYNVAEDALRGYIGSFNSDKAIREITEATSKIEEPTLNASPSMSDTTSTTGTVTGESNAIKEPTVKIKTNLTDDEAIKFAEEILDPNSNKTLQNLDSLTDEARRKVLDCLTPEEIVEKVRELDPISQRRILSSLTSQEISELVSAGIVKGTYEDGIGMPLQTKEQIREYLSKIKETSPEEYAAYQSQLRRISKRWGISMEEAQEVLNQKLAELISSGEVGKRGHGYDTLEAIIDSNRIKNQFETNTSDGLKDLTTRANVESVQMGVPVATPYEDRPVYALLMPSENDRIDDYVINGAGHWYSGIDDDGLISKEDPFVIVYNKDAIIDTSTVSIGDSVNFGRAENTNGITSSSLMTDPVYKGGFDDFGKGLSLEEFQNADLETITSRVYSDCDDTYIEIQIHGHEQNQFNSTNIKEVLVLKDLPERIKQKLAELNIPWRIIGGAN